MAGIMAFIALFFFIMTIANWNIFSYALIYQQLDFAFLSVEHIMRDVALWLVILDIFMHNVLLFFLL